MSNFKRYNDVKKLLGFIHTKPGKVSTEIKVIHDDRVIDTNIDAVLNYTNWIKGRTWTVMGREPRAHIFELVTDRQFQLRDGHVFDAHVFKTDNSDLSINVITTTYGRDGKKYRSELNQFFDRDEYLFTVGMLHSVFQGIPQLERLHDDCVLVVQTNSVSLSYPSDAYVDGSSDDSRNVALVSFSTDPQKINFAVNSEAVDK